jgi:hypothetical protein
MSEEEKPKIKVIVEERTKPNISTGKYTFERKRIKKIANIHELSVDDLGIPGVEGPLLKEPPNNIGGVTVEDLEQDRETSKIISHAEKSLPEGDKD